MSDLVGNPEDRFSHNEAHLLLQGVQGRIVLVVILFQFFCCCFVVAIFDLVHDVKAIHGLC